ncbi:MULTISPECIES: GntR family transcriptional regulator [unclassified Rhizobium]|uniref:GntR family transcriptional regulator n=1 Tax=unclassified Rhizobium TaxID=2613769 RepID=UPI00161C2474|nr:MULTISPECIES: GntR family transcriptional regulator [unclassified Rhizobium]MBB3320197.1 DNA-binding GntR family transcriptional regulator [Rhizobium sp. BK181]MBB3544705.1 DNA-binding GntR family transcriptional regulator [Rhizobium sp. BK399]
MVVQTGVVPSAGAQARKPADGGHYRDDALAPVGRETLQDRVYSQLRNSLINGMFDAGDVLRIVDLAERLQTSTMPVREALGRLVSEQALESLPNRSVRVPLITRERLDDLARARILIEGQMVALALPSLMDDDFAVLKQINVDCDLAFEQHGKDIGHVTSALNQQFHFHIYHAARSQVLIPIVESLWLQSGAIIRKAAHIHDEQGGLAATNHHWALIDALEKRDVEAAMRSLSNDISRSFDLIRGRLDAEPEDGAPGDHHG